MEAGAKFDERGNPPVHLQPSELARLAVVIWCAMLAAKKGEAVRGFKKGVLPFLVVLGIVSGLIIKQPNMSMATLVRCLRCSSHCASGSIDT